MYQEAPQERWRSPHAIAPPQTRSLLDKAFAVSFCHITPQLNVCARSVLPCLPLPSSIKPTHAEVALLPDQAARARHVASKRTLKTFRQLAEAVDGRLFETLSDGTRRVICGLKPATMAPRGLALRRQR